ncbi:MAG: extracellular solute-binding protein, partial [Dehalococcoidia bacterium]|nr:extracellular solute-binding protein [Dehalococcoidia bacterium]
MHIVPLTRLGLATVAAALVAACAAPGAPTTTTGGAAQRGFLPPLRPDQRVTILMENYNLATAGPMREGTLTLLEEFRQRFPNITVETKATASPDIMSSVQAQVAAGMPPDVAQIVFSDLDFAVNNFNARPFEDLIPPDELAQHFQGFHPRGRALGVINGKTYGMPYVFSTPTLFYNGDLFRQAGLDPDRPPRTWAEVRQAGLQIRERTGAPGVYIWCLGTFDWCFQGLVLSAGGRVMTEDRTRLTFAEPPA